MVSLDGKYLIMRPTMEDACPEEIDSLSTCSSHHSMTKNILPKMQIQKAQTETYYIVYL